jgi:drug/metabolite transporter (DMT)-like permease
MIDAVAGPGLAITLALLGAVCFAGAAVLQHRAVAAGSDPTADDRPGKAISLRGLVEIARRPGWLAGLALAACGSGLHAVALVLAPLSVVQPLGVLAVPIAVLLTALRRSKRPAPGVIVGVLLSIAGVGVFVATAAGTAVSSPPPGMATVYASLVVALVVLLLAGLGLARSGWVRCVACAMAGAAAFGLVSALVRAVSQSVASGDVGPLQPPVLAAVAGVGASVLVGGWLVQQAFGSGPPEVVIACLTVVDPIVAVLLGAVLLGEGAATPLETWFLLVGAAVTATAGVISLARHHPDAVAARASRIGPGAASHPVPKALPEAPPPVILSTGPTPHRTTTREERSP